MPESPRLRPEEVLRLLRPVTAGALRDLETGAPPASVLAEAALAGFLTGRGAEPAAAVELVSQWRAAGVIPELIRPARRDELLRRIEANVRDEASAAAFYAELLEAARCRELPERALDYIRHALEDEQQHRQKLAGLYQALSGRTPLAEPEPVAFADLAEGLKKAMDDEYEAFEEYRELYLQAADERLRNLFFELMTDELEHATRFQYVLQIL